MIKVYHTLSRSLKQPSCPNLWVNRIGLRTARIHYHTPFTLKSHTGTEISLATATDIDLYHHTSNWDVAWHASQACCALDNDPIGTKERNPIQYNVQKRLEFWQWWLTEAVPQACKVAL